MARFHLSSFLLVIFIALLFQHSASLVSADSSGSFDSATSAISNYASRAAKYAYAHKDDSFEAAMNRWSSSRLKAYLSARGVSIPSNPTLDDLRTLVLHNAHRAKTHAGFDESYFETWSTQQLIDFLGDKAKGKRDDLIESAKKEYEAAKTTGGEMWKSVTARAARETSYVFETWSESDLKSFLDTWGIQEPKGAKKQELIMLAKKHSRYFTQGPDWLHTGWIRQIRGYIDYAIGVFKRIVGSIESKVKQEL